MAPVVPDLVARGLLTELDYSALFAYCSAFGNLVLTVTDLRGDMPAMERQELRMIAQDMLVGVCDWAPLFFMIPRDCHTRAAEDASVPVAEVLALFK